MKILKQLLGICSTGKPADKGCWSFKSGDIYLGLERAQEILTPGGAIRLEGNGLPGKILVFHGFDGNYYALKNTCTHIGRRRLDPTEEKDRIKCCSVMGSVFNYKGEVVSGPARKPLISYPVKNDSGNLVISVEQGA